jgi:hypothetical protein
MSGSLQILFAAVTHLNEWLSLEAVFSSKMEKSLFVYWEQEDQQYTQQNNSRSGPSKR